MSEPFDHLLIEPMLETKEFCKYLSQNQYNGQGITNNAYARADRFLKHYMPRLADTFDFKGRNVVEIGCGSGSITHAFASCFEKVDAFEILPHTIKLCEKRADLYNLKHMNFWCYPPENLVEQALKHVKSNSIIVLHAVLEHMTDFERIQTLEAIWAVMGPDNYLFIGNTPNRYSYMDLHTHQTSFLLSLPDYIALRYFEIYPDVGMAQHLLQINREEGFEEFCITRRRRGMGVSFHDFQIATGNENLNECVVISNFAKPWAFFDTLLAAYFLQEKIEQPMCFSIRDMHFLMKKPADQNERDKIRTDNQAVRKDFQSVVKNVLSKFTSDL